jgi:hypothetical protein
VLHSGQPVNHGIQLKPAIETITKFAKISGQTPCANGMTGGTHTILHLANSRIAPRVVVFRLGEQIHAQELSFSGSLVLAQMVHLDHRTPKTANTTLDLIRV